MIEHELPVQSCIISTPLASQSNGKDGKITGLIKIFPSFLQNLVFFGAGESSGVLAKSPKGA